MLEMTKKCKKCETDFKCLNTGTTSPNGAYLLLYLPSKVKVKMGMCHPCLKAYFRGELGGKKTKFT